MEYGNRDKLECKSGRAGFVDARLEELRRRWESEYSTESNRFAHGFRHSSDADSDLETSRDRK